MSPCHLSLSRGIWCSNCCWVGENINPNSRCKRLVTDSGFPSLSVGLGSRFLSGQRAWSWPGLCLVSITPKGRRINQMWLIITELLGDNEGQGLCGCSCWGCLLQITEHNNNSLGWNPCDLSVAFLPDTKLSPPGSAPFCACCFLGFKTLLGN